MTALTSSVNPTRFGQSTTFTATVSVVSPGSTVVASPSGTVNFFDGTTLINSGALSTSIGVTTQFFIPSTRHYADRAPPLQHRTV